MSDRDHDVQSSPGPAEGELHPGLKINGRYRLERELGRGGFAVTYLATDLSFYDRPVVVKVLHHYQAADHWALKKFHQEMEALARIDHPGVVGALDSGRFRDGTPYFIMQYVRGTSLRRLVRPGGADLAWAAEIIRHLGYALSAAHEKGICHRDVKPENVVVHTGEAQGFSVKLIDFGIASVEHSKLASTGHSFRISGSWCYMAPEQFKGISSAATDTYSLAVLAYELVTGRLPLQASSPIELAAMHLEGVKMRPRNLRQDLPERADIALLQSLSRDPADRHSSAASFADEFSTAILRSKASKVIPPAASSDLASGGTVSTNGTENAADSFPVEPIQGHDDPLGPTKTLGSLRRRSRFISSHGGLVMVVALGASIAGGLALVSKARQRVPATPMLLVSTQQRPAVLGSAAIFTLKVSESATHAGVRIGDYTFRSYPLRTGDQKSLFSVVAFPYDLKPNTTVSAFVKLSSGVEIVQPLNLRFQQAPMRLRTIAISQAFLKRVTANLDPQGSGELIDRFVKMNASLRAESNRVLRALREQTEKTMLWDGPFLAPQDWRKESFFGDNRNYVFRGQPIGSQIHFGLDLISTRRASVTAANTGKAIYSGPLGIYGDCVVLDHGLGVQSYYGHLSEITVAVGQIVQKGTIIGKTGQTGLAAGDHLHLGLQVNGIEINPEHWWTREWYDNNIGRPLGSSFETH